MNRRNGKAILIVTCTLVFLIATSSHSIAAIDMFLKLSTISGESVDVVHRNEIDVMSWSWGMSQAGSAIIGAGKPTIQDISFTKLVDASTPLLLTSVVTGSIIPSAILTVRKAGGTPFEFLKITLTNVMVSSVSNSGSGVQGVLTETVTFSFQQFRVDYVIQKADGSAGTTITSSYKM